MNGFNSTLNPIGDITREWLAYIPKWKADNPPLDNGCYVCGHCGYFILADEVTLGHIISRSRDPSRVFDPTNIQPEHSSCNSWKGSRYFEPKFTVKHYEFMYFLSNM